MKPFPLSSQVSYIPRFVNDNDTVFIILDFIWYEIGNVPISPYIIKLCVIEFKRRIDLMNFFCMTSMWLTLLNRLISQPQVNTGNTSWSNNSNDESTGRHSLRILDSNLITSCLRNRVKIMVGYSHWATINRRVPQGFVPGSLLFSMFVNDLFYIDMKCEITN